MRSKVALHHRVVDNTLYNRVYTKMKMNEDAEFYGEYLVKVDFFTFDKLLNFFYTKIEFLVFFRDSLHFLCRLFFLL